MKLRKRVFEVLEAHSKTHTSARIVQSFIVVLISTNTIAVILDSVDSIWKQHQQLLYVFEVFSVAIFSAEYLLRLWSCVECEKWRHPILGRLRFAFTPLALIDLLAVTPFYFPFLFRMDLRFLRAIRLTRVFRVLKLGRYSESLRMLGKVLSIKKEELFTPCGIITL